MHHKKRKANSNKLGFMDVQIRDETNEPVFTAKRTGLIQGLRELDDFLTNKLGVKGFSAFEETPNQKKRRKEKEEDMDFF